MKPGMPPTNEGQTMSIVIVHKKQHHMKKTIPGKFLPFPLIIFLFIRCAAPAENTVLTYPASEITSTPHLITLEEWSASVKTIPLQDNGGELIADVIKTILDSNYIFILTSDSKVMKFTPEGQYQQRIGLQGNGPGEYNYLSDIFIDSGSKRIYLSDPMGKILEYDYDGNFLHQYEQAQGIRTFYYAPPVLLEATQVIMGNEPFGLVARQLGGDTLALYPNHLKFKYTPKASVTAYQEYKSLFKTDHEIIFHQMSTDTVFTVDMPGNKLLPRCCFHSENGIKKADIGRFADIAGQITFLYDYAEDSTYRYVTLMTPGSRKQLYLLAKNEPKIYKSDILLPDSDKPFYPKWQQGNTLIDFYTKGTDEKPYLALFEVK